MNARYICITLRVLAFVSLVSFVVPNDALAQMTGAPAARLRLTDRGLLRDGHAADLVVFDPARVRSNATYDRPRQFPDGIEYVVVNGELVVDGGVHTGALPGRALRSQTR